MLARFIQQVKIPATIVPRRAETSLIPAANAATVDRVPEVLEPAPKAEPAETGATKGYLLQVHSLATMSNAETALSELDRIGYPGFVKTEEFQGAKWFVVYLGPYEIRGSRPDPARRTQAAQSDRHTRATGPFEANHRGTVTQRKRSGTSLRGHSIFLALLRFCGLVCTRTPKLKRHSPVNDSLHR